MPARTRLLRVISSRASAEPRARSPLARSRVPSSAARLSNATLVTASPVSRLIRKLTPQKPSNVSISGMRASLNTSAARSIAAGSPRSQVTRAQAPSGDRWSRCMTAISHSATSGAPPRVSAAHSRIGLHLGGRRVHRFDRVPRGGGDAPARLAVDDHRESDAAGQLLAHREHLVATEDDAVVDRFRPPTDHGGTCVHGPTPPDRGSAPTAPPDGSPCSGRAAAASTGDRPRDLRPHEHAHQKALDLRRCAGGAPVVGPSGGRPIMRGHG